MLSRLKNYLSTLWGDIKSHANTVYYDSGLWEIVLAFKASYAFYVNGLTSLLARAKPHVETALESFANYVVTHKLLVLATYALVGGFMAHYGYMSWAAWAIILVFQNLAFTFVSRARNSGSVILHAIAGIFSNGIFFIQFGFLTDKTASAMMHGERGLLAQIVIAIFYTVFTVMGSVIAHAYALATEKGKSAVGANKRYRQITPEEWNAVTDRINALEEAPVGVQMLVDSRTTEGEIKTLIEEHAQRVYGADTQTLNNRVADALGAK